jgi:anti-anti-sigma regulatory factor
MAKKKLELSTRTVEDVTFLRLKGVIDEDNPLASALKKLEGRTVVIDLADVKRINSCGVRDWVNWLADLRAASKQVILVRCSPTIVNQLNLVNNFVGHAVVKSFFAPYYCSRCDTEQIKLLQVRDFAGQAQPIAPNVLGRGCPDGRCQMEFDDIEESYFSFLPRSAGAVVDARIDTLISNLSPSIQDRIKRLDTVEETSTDRGSSAVYNPLTVTSTGISIARDSLNLEGPIAQPPPPPPRNKQSMLLVGVALILAAGVVAYVLLSGR